VNAGERKRRGAEAPVRSEAPEMEDLTDLSRGRHLQQSGTVDMGKFCGNREQDWGDCLRKYERHARALGWRADKMKVDLPLRGKPC